MEKLQAQQKDLQLQMQEQQNTIEAAEKALSQQTKNNFAKDSDVGNKRAKTS